MRKVHFNDVVSNDPNRGFAMPAGGKYGDPALVREEKARTVNDGSALHLYSCPGDQ